MVYNSNMKKAYITVGLPGSGKSTWAQKFMDEYSNILIVNNDTIREQIYKKLGHRNWSKQIENQVKDIREQYISQAASAGCDVIVDNTHLNPPVREYIIKYCESLGFKVEIVDFRHVPIDECIERDSKREGHKKVGEQVIRKMHKNFLKEDSGDKSLPEWHPTSEKQNCIIVDIDGTLAKMKDRGPYDEHLVYNDDVRKHVLTVVLSLMQTMEDLKVFVFSGRSDRAFDETVRWLNDKCGLFVENSSTNSIQPECNVELHMRKSNDNRRDCFVKNDMFDYSVKDRYNVMAIFDDRPQVIRECWKVLNLPVFNVGVIDVEF